MNSEPDWLKAARAELGVHETPGPVATARIEEYDRCTSLKATSDEVPWCSAFINWCFMKCILVGTNSAAAISWLKWGLGLSKPELGCVAVLTRHDPANPDAAHVTFFLKDNGDGTFEGLGGNQHDSVKVSQFKIADVLGWRWPKLLDRP